MTPWIGVELYMWPNSPVHAGIWPSTFCGSHHQLTSAAALLCPEDTGFLCLSSTLALTLSLSRLLQWSVQLWRWECSVLFRFGMNIFEVHYSLEFEQLWASVLVIISCKEKLFWWRLEGALIYRNHKSLGVCLVLCPFSRIAEADLSKHLWSV